MSAWVRDTDADWRHIGGTQPFWGVLTRPEFLQEALTSEALDYFYASGRSDVAGFVKLIQRTTGSAPPWDRALDFGCGTGRLSEAMLDYAGAVTGYDISSGMLEQARRRSSRIDYVDELPDGPFQWINSYIVFQHIPAGRGYDQLDMLLSRLAVGGVVSLHFTVARHADAPREPCAEPPSMLARIVPMLRSRETDPRPVGSVSMYDYDLNRLVAAFRSAGIRNLGLSLVEHGGHYGYVFAGQKAA